MGIGSYFKAPKRALKLAAPENPAETVEDEKPPRAPYAQQPGYGSSRASLSDSVRTRSRPQSLMEDIKHEVMVNYLFQQQCARMWCGDGSGQFEGVLVRKTRSSYLACPPDLMTSSFAAGVMAINLPCAMTINSRVVKTYLSWAPDAVDVPLKGGLRVQVLPSVNSISLVRKAQSAAFCAAEGLLVVWDDGKPGRFDVYCMS